MKITRAWYALMLAFVVATAQAQQILPFPPTPSASEAGLTNRQILVLGGLGFRDLQSRRQLLVRWDGAQYPGQSGIDQLAFYRAPVTCSLHLN